jgi:hypothetical protein
VFLAQFLVDFSEQAVVTGFRQSELRNVCLGRLANAAPVIRAQDISPAG